MAVGVIGLLKAERADVVRQPSPVPSSEALLRHPLPGAS